MDNKGKLFGKVSIVDVIIILVVIIGIVGVSYKYSQSQTVTPFSKTDKIQVTLYVEDVEAFNVEAMEIEDVVKDWKANVTIGKLKDVQVGESVIQGFNQDGEVVLSSRPDHVSLELTVEGEGIFSEKGASTFGNNKYYVNRSMEITVGDVVFWTRISKISKIN